MSRPRRVSVLIIHGVGEQMEFETLDLFTRSLVDAFQRETGLPVRLSHHHRPGDAVAGDFIRLEYDRGGPVELDIHEYYWAHNMKRAISFRETIRWLLRASDGARRFYEENEDLAEKYDWNHRPDGADRLYLKRVGGLIRLLGVLGLATRYAMPSFLDPLYRLLMGKAEELVVDYLGDVAIYTSTDKRLRQYPVRQKVLNGAVAKLRAILEHGCDRLILAGHSLGSVIACDALNRLNLLMNGDPILAGKKGIFAKLITLGSPLDKAAFFLRDHTSDEEYVKKLILNDLFAFRRKDSTLLPPPGVTVCPGVRPILADLPWENYWDPKDPVSGPLDYYRGVGNIRVDNGLSWGFAHVGYWANPEIYRKAISRTLDEMEPFVKTDE